MSHAVGYVIYGVPLSNAFLDRMYELHEDWGELRLEEYLTGLGFRLFSHATGDNLFGYLGICLKKFEDYIYLLKVEDLDVAASELEKVKFDAMAKKLPPEMEEFFKKPDRYVLLTMEE
jgi:hypothetical protein